MSIEAHGAERAVLAILIKEPDKLFEVNDVLSEADFFNTGQQIIFGILRDIILGGGKGPIDSTLIITEAEKKKIDGFMRHTLNGELIDILGKMKVVSANFGKYVKDIKHASIKRALIKKCEDLKDEVENYSGSAVELRNLVETSVLNSLKVIDTGSEDVIHLGNDFEQVINEYANRDGKIGIDVRLPQWQKDIGQIRNGAITGVFARTKVGKSQLSMWSAFNSAVKDNLPTLYLDTELQARQQQMRLCGITCGIPYDIIESGRWKSDKIMVANIKRGFDMVKKAPLFYKNIAGRNLSSVIPIIRKFVYSTIGGPVKGDVPSCLIVYDYIKMMNSQDLSKSIQEYQAIGFLLSGLHDCAADLNVPIMALGQLNKQEEVGIDRIVHNVDSVTVLRPKRPEEIEEDGVARGSHALEVKYARNGCGHEPGVYINVHFDKSCGQFTEDKRSTEVMTVGKKVKQEFGFENTKFSDVREDEF